MKIRNLLLVAAVAGIAFTSCDLESLTPDITVDTELDNEMELAPTTEKSASSVAEDTYTFKSKGMINLNDNADLKEHIDKLKEIEIKSWDINVEGLPEGKSITKVNLKAGLVAVGEEVIVDQVVISRETPFTNGDVISLTEEEITFATNIIEAWEGNYDLKVLGFNVSGESDFDLHDITPPKLKSKIKVKCKVGA